MKNLTKLALAATLVSATAVSGTAQSIGSACGCPNVSSRTTVNLSTLADGSGNLTANATTLTCNNLYILSSKIYVPDGKDLFVEPGTVIKCNDNSGANAHALIVTRGGQIWANGSESCPIIMTSSADPLDGSYSVTNRGKWGGLIILGRAYNNVRNADASVSVTGTDGVGLIEGLVGGDSRHFYGAPIGSEDNDDNSGILRYVSLRHGGELLGTNNEINGLTLGSVGRGTTIEYVEVTSNLDDAFEFFGGTVNASHLVAMHCDDDYIDWDQGYSGKLQFVYGLQGPDNTGGTLNQGDNGFELDSDDAATNNGLRSTGVIYNATIISRTGSITPVDEAIEAKERTQGTIVNSVFAGFRSGLNLASNVTGFWQGGQFQVKNCTFQACTNPLRINGVNTTSGADYTQFTTTDGNIAIASGLIDNTYAMSLVNNTLTDRVNPVPGAGTATTTMSPPVDGFFTGAKYRGAFQPGAEPWTTGWTLAAQLGTDVSAAAGCPGDLNRDGIINAADFSLFVGAFGGNCF